MKSFSDTISIITTRAWVKLHKHVNIHMFDVVFQSIEFAIPPSLVRETLEEEME